MIKFVKDYQFTPATVAGICKENGHDFEITLNKLFA